MGASRRLRRVPVGPGPEVTTSNGPEPVQLTILPFAADEPMVDALREVVLDDRSLRAAFLYRRAEVPAPDADTADLLRPAVGLLAYAGVPTQRTVGRVQRAVGTIHGHVPTIIALEREGLPAVLAVSSPVGAGGEVERAMAYHAVHGRAQGRHKAAPTLRLGLAVAGAVLTVPVASTDRPQSGQLRAGDELRVAVITDGARRFVTAFTSELALLSTSPPTRGAIRVPGSVLASSLPDGVDIALDPGCGLTTAIEAAVVKELGRPAPA